MNLLQKSRQYFSKKLSHSHPTAAERAYDLWSESYDQQPDNLMLALDEEIFSELIKPLNLKNKIIADIGCGTGRHWMKIFSQQPKKLMGFDVSNGMLKILQQKFSWAETHLLGNNGLIHLKNDSCDFIFSTLTIAHIKEAKKTLNEWNRVLKPGGEMVITDFHPVALAKGGKRTFVYQNKTLSVINYVHTIPELMEIADQLHLKVLQVTERIIDEKVKSYYEKNKALSVYDAWKGTPIIYGIHLKKTDAAL
ncbi:MAG: class I SAM-dependent methyltransferase [Ginsengibacter sp.]